MDPKLRSALTAYVFGVLGVFLVLAPWSALYRQVLIWAEVSSTVGTVLAGGWFRGAISGIGLLDLAVAVREARRLSGASGGRPTGAAG